MEIQPVSAQVVVCLYFAQYHIYNAKSYSIDGELCKTIPVFIFLVLSPSIRFQNLRTTTFSM